MPTDRQLKWVYKNRQRRWRDLRIGELAKWYLRPSAFRSEDNHAKIQGTLETVLGSVLAGHCTVGRIIRGVLTIYVDDVAVMYHLRTEAKESLLQAFTVQKRGGRIRDVRFLLHTDGG